MIDSNILTFEPHEVKIDERHTKPRFTVAKGLLPEIKASDMYFVLEDGVPHRLICENIISRQKNNFNPHANEAYCIAKFMNAVLSKRNSIENVTIYDIKCYFESQQQLGIGVRTIRNNIDFISRLFDSFVINNQPIHDSITDFNSEIVILSGRKKENKLTIISCLKNYIKASTFESEEYMLIGYTKWYTPDQVSALFMELCKISFAYGAIFLDTVLLGHRIDSALSILLEDTDFRAKRISPSRSKTNKTHVSALPQSLDAAIRNYLFKERNSIVTRTGSMSPYLFLNKRGNPVKYNTYYKALKVAAKRANAKDPSLNITNVHTHAGRSTFAAAIRSKQLEDQRAGRPTFSDNDICTQLDWKRIETLDHYDKVTRVQEAISFTVEVQEKLAAVVNRLLDQAK